MKVLWLVNVKLPIVYKAQGEVNKTYVGGWLDQISEKFIKENNLVVIYPSPNVAGEKGKNDHLSYYAAFTCANSIVLEDNVLLGSGCKIYDTDFHALEYTERVKGNYKGAPINTAPVKIDEGVFIGAGSFVLKGVHIGKHSIIGAGSVVTKDIPKNEIWAGNPAKFIRKIED